MEKNVIEFPIFPTSTGEMCAAKEFLRRSVQCHPNNK